MKIAIAGYGVEGEESYRYWSNKIIASEHTTDSITIVDEQPIPNRPLPRDTATILGEGAFDALDDFDMVIRTPSLPPHAIHTKGVIWSATNEFFAECPAPIIGVTGSKGKGTTASLITSILEMAGKKVWLVGNIGLPALQILADIQKDDIVVYELSSFQLWDLQRSPETAVVLMLEQEHLDVHKDMDEYVTAKSHITTYQTSNDTLIYNANNQYAQSIASLSTARKIPFPSDATAHVSDGYFYYGTQKLCTVDNLRIIGAHNQTNAVAAIDAAWCYMQQPDAVKKGLAAFHGLAHRLSFVATINGVSYYDDSIATTPSSAIVALRAFADIPKVIILGGSYKGSDFSELAQEIHQTPDIHVLLIGDEASRIAEALNLVGFSQYQIITTNNNTANVAEVLTRRAAELAQPGGVVLLSPAAASFGLFKNYADRGDQFIAAVHKLQKGNT